LKAHDTLIEIVCSAEVGSELCANNIDLCF
jgi:hypothetical protein